MDFRVLSAQGEQRGQALGRLRFFVRGHTDVWRMKNVTVPVEREGKPECTSKLCKWCMDQVQVFIFVDPPSPSQQRVGSNQEGAYRLDELCAKSKAADSIIIQLMRSFRL